MTSLAEVASVSRNLSRDFGSFFEENFATVGSTLKLPHPLVDGSTVSVRNNTDGSAVTGFMVNERNGLLKLPEGDSFPDGVTVTGIYHEWFSPEDLNFHARMIATEHLHGRTGMSLEQINGAEVEVMAIGAILMGYWSLLAEFATDIDVSTPESMNIPARQRFAQVQNFIALWQQRYDEKAAMLNVGLKRTEMFTLRRISRTTNRYVPIYRGREIDDPRWPTRVRPPIDPIAPTPYEDEEAYWGASSDMQTESFDLGLGGWGSVGTMG